MSWHATRTPAQGWILGAVFLCLAGITGLTIVLGDESPGEVQVGLLLTYIGLGVGICAVAAVHTALEVRAQRRAAHRTGLDSPSSAAGVSA